MLIFGEGVDDEVGNLVLLRVGSVVESDMLDREVDQVDRVVDSNGDGGLVVASEEGTNTSEKRLLPRILESALGAGWLFLGF